MSECLCPSCRNIGPDFEAEQQDQAMRQYGGPPPPPNPRRSPIVDVWMNNPHLTLTEARTLTEKEPKK